ARALGMGAADRRDPPHHRGARGRRAQLQRRGEGAGSKRGARRRRLQGRQARPAVLRGRRAESRGSRGLGGRAAPAADESAARLREAHEVGAQRVLLLDRQPGAAHRRRRRPLAGADHRRGDRRRRARSRRRRLPVRQGDAREQEGPGRRPPELQPVQRNRGGQGAADPAAPSRRDQILQGSRHLEGISGRASRVTQEVLATLLIAGSIAWSLDLFRPVGLVLFAEQFAAAAYAIGLALTFLRFRFRKTHVEESGYAGDERAAPWYGWLLVSILLVIGGYVLIGHLVPGQLTTREVALADMLNYLNLDNTGLLGVI